MEIRATGTLNYDSVKALIHLEMFKKANPKKRMIMWNVLVGIMFLIIIAEAIMWGVDLQSLWMVGLAVVLCFLNCFMYFLFPKMRYKAYGDMKDGVNEYVFTDEVIKITSSSSNYNGSAELNYSIIAKVMETSKYYFIFGNKLQVLMVEKATIEGGTESDIRNKLSTHLGKRYIVCNY